MYKAMTFMERSKHMDPHMSLAIKGLVKSMYSELKDLYGNKSLDKSLQSSTGFIDGLSLSQFKISDDLSNVGSEISITQSALFSRNLETIKELPPGTNKMLNNESLDTLAQQQKR